MRAGIIGVLIIGATILYGIATNDPAPAGSTPQGPTCNFIMAGWCDRVDKVTATVTSGTEVIR